MKAEQRGQRLCVQQNPQPAPFSPGTMWWPERDLHDPPTALRGGANSTGGTAEVHRRHWTSSRLRHVTINTQPHNVGLCARPAQWLTPPEQWGSRWPHSHPVPPQRPRRSLPPRPCQLRAPPRGSPAAAEADTQTLAQQSHGEVGGLMSHGVTLRPAGHREPWLNPAPSCPHP